MCVKIWSTAQSQAGERVWCRSTCGPCGSQDGALLLQPPAFLRPYHPRLATLTGLSRRAAVPNLFGTRDRFCGRQFLHSPGGGGGFGMIQAHHVCYAATDLAGGGAPGKCKRCGAAADTDGLAHSPPLTLLCGSVPSGTWTGDPCHRGTVFPCPLFKFMLLKYSWFTTWH